MSKMGISTIASYRCSKLFEAVGLHDDVVGLCFQGAVSRIGGASFEDFQQDLLNLSKRAWLARKPISQGPRSLPVAMWQSLVLIMVHYTAAKAGKTPITRRKLPLPQC